MADTANFESFEKELIRLVGAFELIDRGVIDRNNLDIEAHLIKKCTELVF